MSAPQSQKSALKHSEMHRGAVDSGRGRGSPACSFPWGKVPGKVKETGPGRMVRVEDIASKFSLPSHYWEKGFIILTERSTLLWALHGSTCVEMTPNQAIRITNLLNNIVIAVSPQKDSFLFLGNSGAIFGKENGIIEVTAYEQRNKNDKYSKINVNKKEVTFSSRECALSYTIDEGRMGLRKTKIFNPLYQDFSYDILNHHGKNAKQYEADAVDTINRTKYGLTPQCTQLWRVDGVRIAYSFDCDLQVVTTNPEMEVTLSFDGSCVVQTPYLRITSSKGKHPHMYLKKDGLRIYYDGLNYINRSGSQSAGFDRLGVLKTFALY